jgi:outer membrane cobalamin receptor
MFRHPLVNGLAADVTYFKNVVNDLILWQEYRPNVWSPENIGRAAIQGVETRLSLNPLRDVLHLEWNYTYLDARNRTSNAEEFNRQLPYRPKYVHNVSARVELSGVYCILSSSQVAERFTTTSNTVSLPTYRVTNILIGVRRAFEPLEVGVKLEIRNAENLRYQALEGFPMPGREIRFSFEGELFHVAGSQ